MPSLQPPSISFTAQEHTFEVWYRVQAERWPNTPEGHYIGPDGRLLSPADFAVYRSAPGRLVLVLGEGSAATPHS